MKKVLACLKGYGKDSVLGPLLKFVEAFFELLVPIVVAAMIDKGIGEENKRYIIICIAILVVLATVGIIVSITAKTTAARESTKNAIATAPNTTKGERKSRRRVILTPVCI